MDFRLVVWKKRFILCYNCTVVLCIIDVSCFLFMIFKNQCILWWFQTYIYNHTCSLQYKGNVCVELLQHLLSSFFPPSLQLILRTLCILSFYMRDGSIRSRLSVCSLAKSWNLSLKMKADWIFTRRTRHQRLFLFLLLLGKTRMKTGTAWQEHTFYPVSSLLPCHASQAVRVEMERGLIRPVLQVLWQCWRIRTAAPFSAPTAPVRMDRCWREPSFLHCSGI